MKAATIILATWLVATTAALYFDEKKLIEQETLIGQLKVELTSKANSEKKKIAASASWIAAHSNRISDKTAEQIAVAAFTHKSPILIIALIEAESEFTPTAVSKAGAVGLGQIMYEVHKKELENLGIYKKRELFDIDNNIKATSHLFQMMLTRSKGDVVKALHMYLGGKDGKYVNRIFSSYVLLSLEIENAKTQH